MMNSRNRKRCPVCKFDRTYTGVVCPKCEKLGFKYNEASNKVSRVTESSQVKIRAADVIREHHGLKETGNGVFSVEEVMVLLEKVHSQYNNGSSI